MFRALTNNVTIMGNTIKSNSIFLKFSLKGINDDEYLLTDIGLEPKKLLCVKRINTIDYFITIIDTQDKAVDYELYASPSAICYTSGALILSGIGLISYALLKNKK